MLKTYEDERKELLKKYLEITFFKGFTRPHPEINLFSTVELQITSGCNLRCDYCYYTKYKELNNLNNFNREEILENTELLLNFFRKNNLVPPEFQIFSGEPLIHKNLVFDILKNIVDFYYDMNHKGLIVIPTNVTWIKDDEIVEKVLYIDQYAKSKNVRIFLSASFDGKYMDKYNREYIKKSKSEEFYSDEYYDKIFNLYHTFYFGFHPMIYSNKIDFAIKNFLWFQYMFKKHNIPWFNIYLLEVRNKGWNKQQVNKFKEFLKFVYNWVLHEKLNGDKRYFIDHFIFKNPNEPEKNLRNMNLFNEFSTISRGIGCSLQTTLFVKLQDLTVNSCHRMSYESQNGFKFVKNNKEITDIIPLNFEFYNATMSYSVQSAPYCENCLLKNSCSGGCLGSNFESTGDWFTVHPSVCLLEHGKHLASTEFLVENNIFEDVIKRIDSKKAIIFEKLKDWRYGKY